MAISSLRGVSWRYLTSSVAKNSYPVGERNANKEVLIVFISARRCKWADMKLKHGAAKDTNERVRIVVSDVFYWRWCKQARMQNPFYIWSVRSGQYLRRVKRNDDQRSVRCYVSVRIMQALMKTSLSVSYYICERVCGWGCQRSGVKMQSGEDAGADDKAGDTEIGEDAKGRCEHGDVIVDDTT